MKHDIERVNPNPRIVALISYAIQQVASRLAHKPEYADWLLWARSWNDGERVPIACVDVANRCFRHEGDHVFHCLGQLAWGAKEACYGAPATGWLVVRYIADAMVAFNIEFPERLAALEPPTIEAEQPHP